MNERKRASTRLRGTPVGDLELEATDRGLAACRFVRADAAEVEHTSPSGPAAEYLARAAAELRAYFEGSSRAFGVPLDLHGTVFQRRVWDELLRIPYGRTISYAELARRVGVENGARAVGLANGRNPVAIIVPCHRVIAGNGSLHGYGGGLERKRALLALECGCEDRAAGPSERVRDAGPLFATR